MSIGVCGKVQKRCVDTDILEGMIDEVFVPSSDFTKEETAEGAIYRGIDQDNILTIFFIRDNESRYNVWYSEIMHSEYQYSQSVSFDIWKEDATIAVYQSVIHFFICLREKVESDILVTSDVHNDICLLKAGETLWSPDLPADFKQAERHT